MTDLGSHLPKCLPDIYLMVDPLLFMLQVMSLRGIFDYMMLSESNEIGQPLKPLFLLNFLRVIYTLSHEVLPQNNRCVDYAKKIHSYLHWWQSLAFSGVYVKAAI
jgi:hypothetical protein